MNKITKALNNAWLWIGATFAVLTIFLFRERSRRKQAESKLLNSEVAGESKVLQERIDNNNNAIANSDNKLTEEKEKVASESIDAIAEWFRKRR
jgi:hypothetical protein